MTKRHLFACLLLAPVTTAVSAAAVLALRDSRGDILVRPSPTTRINWTAGYASALSSVPLPRIVNDRADADFGQPGTARSLSDARAVALASARQRAERDLVQLIGGLRVNSDFTLLERLRRDRALRQRFGSIAARFSLRSTRTGEGKVSVEVAVPFRGQLGLYSVLVDDRYSTEPVPEGTGEDLEDKMTGIIIDASELPRFEPSLELRLYTDSGRRIYGPETIGRHCAVSRGAVVYARNREDAARTASLGLHPYYTLAAGLLGSGRSDLFLSGEDARRILASTGGRRALRSCAVAVVIARR